MKHFGLLGCNLLHTMSQPIHTALMEYAKVDGEYSIYDIPEDQFESSLDQLFALDGFNVTIPYKTKIIPFLDGLDSTAERMGAVNVVCIRNGKKIGYNTDCVGFTQSLQHSNIALEGKVAIVGIGGVGRMFAIESALNGCSITLLLKENQWERGADLCREIERYGVSANLVPLETITGKYNLLINATPVGMFPHTNQTPIPKEHLSIFQSVFDCIYNPTETLLMQNAAEMGLNVLGGLPMLVYQAAEAQEIWNSTCFEKSMLDQIILDTTNTLETA